MTHNQSYTKTEDFAAANGIGTSETTTGSNGYPQGLKLALTDFATITQLEEIESKLKLEGHEVEVIQLHKRDGWNLWNRDRTSVSKGMYAKSGENDWTVEIAPTDDLKQVALNVVCGDDEESLNNPSLIHCAEVFAKDLAYYQNELRTMTVFFDPDQNYRIDYVVDEETTGYAHDTHSYKLGLLVGWVEREYVVEVTDKDGLLGGYLSEGSGVDDRKNMADTFDDQDSAAEAMQSFAMSDAAKGKEWKFEVVEK